MKVRAHTSLQTYSDLTVPAESLSCSCRFGPYFCSPVIAGLEQDGTPYLCGMDTIGAIETAHDFMVAGTAPDSLYGMCESMWRPDLVSAQHLSCCLPLSIHACLIPRSLTAGSDTPNGTLRWYIG